VPKDEFKEDLKNVLKTVIKIWKNQVAWRIKGTKWKRTKTILDKSSIWP
jgi:hypothetical protein